ncbi:hypothetical protein BDF22DRAFT_743526 [Syncephalis plumigaleata]|nr:hypothetical protein BDF22DRAFT_743526 [Syncephalis plumigaleata]
MNNTSSVIIFGIKPNPSGEMTLFQAVSNELDQRALAVNVVHQRLTGAYLQFFINIIVSCIFLYNLKLSIKAVRSKSSNIAGWCSLCTSILGSAVIFVNATLLLSEEMNCRKFTWYVIWAMTISTFLNGIIILHRGYLALRRQRWVIFAGSFLILPQIGFGFFAMIYAPISFDDAYGCVVGYSQSMSWCWFGITMPVNTLFSAIFCYVTYSQYLKFGSDAWKRLARNGIQRLCLVISFNIVCDIIITTKVIGNFSQFFFVFDWVTTSTILTNYCVNMRGRSSSPVASNENKPKHESHTELKLTFSTLCENIMQATFFRSFRF